MAPASAIGGSLYVIAIDLDVRYRLPRSVQLRPDDAVGGEVVVYRGVLDVIEVKPVKTASHSIVEVNMDARGSRYAGVRIGLDGGLGADMEKTVAGYEDI